MAFVTLLVKGDTLKIFERRSVALSSEETVTFVQTDKPIYKSGENGKSIFMFPSILLISETLSSNFKQSKHIIKFKSKF